MRAYTVTNYANAILNGKHLCLTKYELLYSYLPPQPRSETRTGETRNTRKRNRTARSRNRRQHQDKPKSYVMIQNTVPYLPYRGVKHDSDPPRLQAFPKTSSASIPYLRPPVLPTS